MGRSGVKSSVKINDGSIHKIEKPNRNQQKPLSKAWPIAIFACEYGWTNIESIEHDHA